MKKQILLLVSALLPLVTLAQSNFDGTWKTDVTKHQATGKPLAFELQNGTFKCDSCDPPYEVKADGQDHSRAGDPYVDTVAIKVVDDKHVDITAKKNGKAVQIDSLVVSAEGNTLNVAFSDASDTNAAPVTGKATLTRVTAGRAGSHAISGTWHPTKEQGISENGLLVTFKLQGNSLTMTNPTGQSYTAKLDGAEAPFKGDPGVTSVSVKRIDPSTIEESDKRNGKVIAVIRMTVSSDGKTMIFLTKYLDTGHSYKDVAVKQ